MSETRAEEIRPSVSADPDPLGKLYHMSTTAGVGSQDYVAVNVISVVAILLGLSSSLALLDPMLLAMPLLAVLFSAIALWQIARSGGTQTGRLLAWGGITLAVLFAAMEGTRIAAEHRQDAEDKLAIASLVDQLTQAVRSDAMDQGYALFSSDFRERVTMDKFTSEMHLVRENPSYGKFVSLNLTGDLLFEGGYDEDVRQAVTRLEIRFDKHAAGVIQVTFRRRDGLWSIDNLPELFPPPSQAR